MNKICVVVYMDVIVLQQVIIYVVITLLTASELAFPFLTPYKGFIQMFIQLLNEANKHEVVPETRTIGVSTRDQLEAMKESSTEPSSSSAKTIKTWSSD